MAAVAAYIGPVALVAGTMLSYMAFDFLWWTLLAYFIVHLLTTGNPRWWLGIGTAIGLGMLTKYTIIYFTAGLVVAILLNFGAPLPPFAVAVGRRRACHFDLPAQPGVAGPKPFHFF